MEVPFLRLSAGQLLWSLNRGQVPDALLRNEVRYLRQLGVPHDEEDVAEGRGNRIFYKYEDLVELGVAVYAIRHGMKPRDVAKVLIKERRANRRQFRLALEEQPGAALKAPWVKSRGELVPILAKDQHLRLHDRTSAPAGHFEIGGLARVTHIEELFGAREVFRDGESRVLVPLTRIALELTAWALEAPAIRPGRTSGR